MLSANFEPKRTSCGFLATARHIVLTFKESRGTAHAGSSDHKRAARIFNVVFVSPLRREAATRDVCSCLRYWFSSTESARSHQLYLYKQQNCTILSINHIVFEHVSCDISPNLGYRYQRGEQTPIWFFVSLLSKVSKNGWWPFASFC